MLYIIKEIFQNRRVRMWRYKQKETLFVISLNKNDSVISIHQIRGSGGFVEFTDEDILKHIKTDRIVLVHNHPGGDARPSKEDLYFINLFTKRNPHIELVDFIIFSSLFVYSHTLNSHDLINRQFVPIYWYEILSKRKICHDKKNRQLGQIFFNMTN